MVKDRRQPRKYQWYSISKFSRPSYSITGDDRINPDRRAYKNTCLRFLAMPIEVFIRRPSPPR